jgi:hypothetical protein
MYRMLPWLPEPTTVFNGWKFTSHMSEKFAPFLAENGKDGNPLLNQSDCIPFCQYWFGMRDEALIPLEFTKMVNDNPLQKPIVSGQ